MIPESNIDYQTVSYEELSKEFRDLYPKVTRAFQLVPLMYNRLTLFDKLSHAEALTKMYADHKDLPGFSRRNIYRYLPLDNPNIPHRFVPSRHKVQLNLSRKPRSATLVKDGVEAQFECHRCSNLLKKNIELEEALTANSRFTTGDKVQTKKIFRIPIDVDEIRHYINEVERIESNYIWIIVCLDIERGNIDSVIVENVNKNNTKNKGVQLGHNAVIKDDTSDDSDNVYLKRELR